jgi:hypothetical protein
MYHLELARLIHADREREIRDRLHERSIREGVRRVAPARGEGVVRQDARSRTCPQAAERARPSAL